MPRVAKSHRKRIYAEKPDYAKWYHLPLWRRLRQSVMERDAWICQACGKPTGESGNCDHIRPHKGDWQLFVDEANLQALCQICHSAKSAVE